MNAPTLADSHLLGLSEHEGHCSPASEFHHKRTEAPGVLREALPGLPFSTDPAQRRTCHRMEMAKKQAHARANQDYLPEQIVLDTKVGES